MLRVRRRQHLLKFSIKNVFRKKSVAVLSSLGIGFGLMLQFVLGAFSAGVALQVQENLQAALGRVELVEYGEIGASSELPPSVIDVILDSDIGDDLLGHNGKRQLPPKYTLPYLGNLNNGGDAFVIVGVNKSTDEPFGGPTSKVATGRAFLPGEDEVILDSRLLGFAAPFPTTIGETLVVYINVTQAYNLTIVGIYTQQDNGAPSFVPREYYGFVSIETAWKLQALEGDANGTFSQVELQFPPVSNNKTREYVDQIKTLSNDGAFGATFVEAFSLGEFQESIGETLGVLNTFISVIGFITLLAGGMAIIVAQLNSISSRMKEFAILKATGWKNVHLFKNVIYESLLLGVMGAIIGLLLGVVLIAFIGGSGGLFGSGAGVIVTPNLIVNLVIFALGIGVIGGIYPAAKAAGVRPVKVLKGE